MKAFKRLSCTLVLACAAGFAASPAAEAQDVLTPPIPLGNTHPVLVAAYPDTIYAVNITVDVDATGKPDLMTLKLDGSAAELNHKAIRDWLRKTTFRPARRNGVPERSTFKMTAETLKQAGADS